MARTTISAETATYDGLNVTYTAAIADGHKAAFNIHTVLHFKNGGGEARTVTFLIPTTVAGQAVASKTVAIPAGQQRLVRGFTQVFAQADGMLWWDYDATTSLTVGVVN